MGLSKLKIELVSKEKARYTRYSNGKRKRLRKMAQEFSALWVVIPITVSIINHIVDIRSCRYQKSSFLWAGTGRRLLRIFPFIANSTGFFPLLPILLVLFLLLWSILSYFEVQEAPVLEFLLVECVISPKTVGFQRKIGVVHGLFLTLLEILILKRRGSISGFVLPSCFPLIANSMDTLLAIVGIINQYSFDYQPGKEAITVHGLASDTPSKLKATHIFLMRSYAFFLSVSILSYFEVHEVSLLEFPLAESIISPDTV
ncbi:hypothetical protein RJ641_029161, partial [Dillenia turbinata]